jgi:hypothetical protein
MKDLKPYIDESLFSGDNDEDNIAKSTEDNLKIENLYKLIDKRTSSMSSSPKELENLNIELKDDLVYISTKSSGPVNNTMFQLKTNRATNVRDIYPLNIKGLDTGRSRYPFFIVISDNFVKSAKEVFSNDFTETTSNPSGSNLSLWFMNCPHLKSLEGCPKIVRSFSLLFNHDLKSFEGMPSFICQDLYIETRDFTIDIKAADQEHSVIKPHRNVPESYALKTAKNIYSMLDPKCGVAKMLKFKIEEIEFRRELGNSVTQAARRLQKTQF